MVIPKAEGDISICVGMTCANQAIVRGSRPNPTIEEVLQDLNGSTVVSRVDLKWGFHQIRLAEESRHVTTFVTHLGLYRLIDSCLVSPQHPKSTNKSFGTYCEAVKVWLIFQMT